MRLNELRLEFQTGAGVKNISLSNCYLIMLYGILLLNVYVIRRIADNGDRRILNEFCRSKLQDKRRFRCIYSYSTDLNVIH
jgi:hypothetical protein